MEMDNKKARYYEHKNKVEKNQKTKMKEFKNKIGKLRRNNKWN